MIPDTGHRFVAFGIPIFADEEPPVASGVPRVRLGSGEVLFMACMGLFITAAVWVALLP